MTAAAHTLRQRFGLGRFLRGNGPAHAPLRLDRRRVYILPTRAGLSFAVLLMVMLIGAINYNNSLAYLLTFLLAGIGLVTMLHTYRGLLGLRLSLGQTAPVFAGEQATVPLVVDNRDGPARFGIALGCPGSEPLHADVPARQITRLPLPWPSHRRGRHPVGRFTLATRFPLGLFRAWSPVELHGDVLVYPAPAASGTLPEPGRYQPELSGDQGEGADDFAGFRPYHPGDSLRHVHWKALAREQELLTKRFGGDRAEALWLDWAATTGATETRLAHLTRWVLEAQIAGLHYGLILPGLRLAPAHGAEHRERCLSALALFGLPDGVQPPDPGTARS